MVIALDGSIDGNSNIVIRDQHANCEHLQLQRGSSPLRLMSMSVPHVLKLELSFSEFVAKTLLS